MAAQRLKEMKELAMQEPDDLLDELEDTVPHASNAQAVDADDHEGLVHSPPANQPHQATPVQTVLGGCSMPEGEPLKKQKNRNVEAGGPTNVKRKKSSHDGEPKKGGKKQKHHDEAPRVTVVPLDEKFLEQTYDEWRTNPIAASIRVIAQMGEVHKIQTDRLLRETKAQLEVEIGKKAELEQELVLMNNSLTKANNSLEKRKNDLRTAETARDNALLRVKNAEDRVKELEDRIKELTAVEEKAKEKMKTLEDRVEELQNELKKNPNQAQSSAGDVDKLATLQARLSRTQTALKESRIKAKEAGEKSVQLYKDGFEEALKQLAITHPDLEIDKNVVNSDHTAEGDQIVYIDPSTEEKTIRFYSRQD